MPDCFLFYVVSFTVRELVNLIHAKYEVAVLQLMLFLIQYVYRSIRIVSPLARTGAKQMRVEGRSKWKIFDSLWRLSISEDKELRRPCLSI